MSPPYLTFYQQRVNHGLESLFNQPSPFKRLDEAMRYAVIGGGKRFRAALVYATVEALEGNLYLADCGACALELIHAYSLIHDDLPAMDNDDWRRGKPTVHIQFGEANAILAGDALQTLAFQILADQKDLTEIQRIQQIQALARASGYHGMVAGQAIDIDAAGGVLTQEDLEKMHALKTGALINASIELGLACVPTVPAQAQESLRRYATLVGLAFQVQDDVLDATSTLSDLGKSAGADALNNKPTFVSLLGVEKAQQYAHTLIQNALENVAIFGDYAANLRNLAKYCIERKN